MRYWCVRGDGVRRARLYGGLSEAWPLLLAQGLGDGVMLRCAAATTVWAMRTRRLPLQAARSGSEKSAAAFCFSRLVPYMPLANSLRRPPAFAARTRAAAPLSRQHNAKRCHFLAPQV